jgi:c(7)-type cytochrome triheme protein
MEDEFGLRRMDCVDCHNRVAHSFEDASGSIDEALFAGKIDPRLPFIKREGLRVLSESYPSREAASQQIPAEIYQFYRSNYPETSARNVGSILNASAALVAVYQRNVWPEYGVTWGLHENHGGHEDYPGCFRCHNDDQISQDGEHRPLGDDCTACHAILTDRAPISLPLVSDAPLTSTRLSLPRDILFQTRAGDAKFDHAQHLEYEKGRCVTCHNALFPMARADLGYAPSVHQAAERSQTSCAGCHVSGGAAFATANNCEKCHSGLSPKRLAIARGPEPPSPLPATVSYQTPLGAVEFDHAEHLEETNGECVDCHNQLFPMQEAKLDYASNMHRDAERTRTSCAGCHVAGGEAFASADNCTKCHADLGVPKPTPNSGVNGIPVLAMFETRLGPARFDHQKHIDEAKGDCKACHNEVFPLERGLLNYKDNLHKTAETAKTACGACHNPNGTAFESKGHCLTCHSEPSIHARGSDLGLPKGVVFKNRLGDVSFDHDQHIEDAGGKCVACHDQIWPMAEASLAGYSEDYHQAAERSRVSCAACHAPNEESFSTLNNCVRCHEHLELEPAQASEIHPSSAFPQEGRTGER